MCATRSDRVSYVQISFELSTTRLRSTRSICRPLKLGAFAESPSARPPAWLA